MTSLAHSAEFAKYPSGYYKEEMVDVSLSPPSDATPCYREFTTAEAADFLRCSEGYLIKLRQIGGGPPYQRRFKRRGIFYKLDDLMEWRTGRRYLSTSEY